MASTVVIRLLALLVLTLSVTALPSIVHGDYPPPSNGTTPQTQWVPSGPAADKIFYSFFDSDTSELNAMCVGQPIGCTPSVDLTDVPLPGSDLQSAGCVPNPSVNGGCAENDPRFWTTTPTEQLGMLQVDFNHASTLWGVTFCNGRDGVTAGVTTCSDLVGGASVTASCPNVPAPHAGDCTWAALNIRQGIAALINCAVFVIDDTPAIGPNAVCMDNPTTPASNALHSGYPNDNANPCNGGYPCTVPNPNCGGTGCNTVGPYSVDPTTDNVVAPGTAGAYKLGGACSWDAILGCGTPAISAEHYYNDLTNSFGTNVPPCGGSGQPACPPPGGVNLGRDFCNAARHFIQAGLATGMNNVCELTGEFPNLASPAIPVVFKGRASLGRDNMWRGLTSSVCQLIALGNANCSGNGQLYSQEIGLGTAHQQVFRTGCKNGAADGSSCATQGPNTPANTVALGQPFTQSWDFYTGGFFFPTPTPNDLWSLYDSSFASNYCGGAPGEEPPDYDYVCNPRNDFWGEQSQFSSSTPAALAALQVAHDIFGNHTFTKVVWTPSIQYPYAKGWNGVSNAAGIGTAQGNPWTLLNSWSANPAISGPTIRWGQKDATASLNPFTFSSVVEADVFNEIYDPLLQTNPFNPNQIIGWMANFVRVETHATQPTECPATYTNSRGTSSVGACVKMTIRGDIPWHDVITACATPTAACLGDHVVTASDIKFSFASFNATGALASPGTLNTIDIIGLNGTSAGLAPQLPASAFSAVGGANGAGISETFLFLLHSNNAYALNDIFSVPIIPQRLWACQANTPGTKCTNVQHMPNGFLNPCITLDTPACTADPALLGGAQSDPVATNRLVGSGPFVCASGDLGASGTVIGGGCTSSGTQSIPFGGSAVLRRFSKGANGLDPNFAYFRSNEKFLQFQWAAYAPGTNSVGASATISDIISAINACKPNSAALGGVVSYQACAHWNTSDAGLSTVSSAGTAIGVTGGGHGSLPGNPLPVTTQIQQWIGRGAWVFTSTGATSYSTLTGAQPIPQTLYADGSVYGSFQLAVSSTAVSATVPFSTSVAVSVSLSGGPDNNFTGTTLVTLSTVQSPGLTASLGTSSLTLTPRSPTGSTTLTLGATLPPTSTSVSCTPATVNVTQGQGTTCNAVVSNSNKFTVILIASSPGFPSVTAAVTITITNPSTAAATGSVSWTSSASGTFTPGSSCIVYIQCSVTYTPTLVSPLVTTQEIEAHYNGDSSHAPSIGRVLLNVDK